MKSLICIFYWALCLGIPLKGLYAQGTPVVTTPDGLQIYVNNLKTAFEDNDAAKIALAYEQLGDGYFQRGAYSKAEPCYEKARFYYEQSGQKEAAVRSTRALAKTQELQNKPAQATLNFENAGRINLNTPQSGSDLNRNDAERLKNSGNPLAQQPYLLDNFKRAQNAGNQAEIALAYRHLGDNDLSQNKLPEAAKNYENALNQSENIGQAIQFSNQIANAYTTAGKYEEAIGVQQKLLERPEVQQNVPTQISQINYLADLYFQKNEAAAALALLKKSYDLALVEHRTLDAKSSLEKIAAIHLQQGNTPLCIDLYKRFLSQLDSLLQDDPSLVDIKTLAATEEKIAQLESEKVLKEQLMLRQNRFNYFLLGASGVLLLLLLFIYKALTAIKIKNKKIALQSLRREMNPHFVFNSLNSINHYIAQNNELEANKYLSAYATLMRKSMENANKDFVPLSSELDLLKQYLDLEQLRFSDKFEYQIQVSDDIDPDAEQVPNMILQPHLENAIWHGLRYKDEKGVLCLKVLKKEGAIWVYIEDNGIGLTKSKEAKTVNQQTHHSRGLSNTAERIQLLNQIYGKNIQCTITEKTAPQTGTIVKINL